jgi:hypothetical protein
MTSRSIFAENGRPRAIAASLKRSVTAGLSLFSLHTRRLTTPLLAERYRFGMLQHYRKL